MNFGGGQQYQQQQSSQVAFMQAEYEMEMMTDLFNKLLDTCHKKCISPKYNESDLNKGEAVCIDRCSMKYMDVFQRVGARLNSLSAVPATTE